MADRIEEVLGDARMPQILTPAQIAAIAAALHEARIGDLAQAWDEGYAEPRECCGSCPRGWCPWDAGRSGPTNPYREGGDADG